MAELTDLEKLAELRDKGIISKKDFEQKKKVILANFINNNSTYCYSPKSRTVFALLAFFLGVFGVHNFYLEKYIKGFFQLLPWLIFINDIEFAVIYVLIVYPFWLASNIMNTKKDGQGRYLDMNEGKTLCEITALILAFGWLLIPAFMG